MLAPAAGTILAVWEADWGWGSEGAILIRHGRSDLGLGGSGPVYYSEFDHIDFGQLRHFGAGQRIARGQRIATVGRPGGNRRYLPEVHWEVWEVRNDSALRWIKNRRGKLEWRNSAARLVDPLYMLSLNGGIQGRTVQGTPFDRGKNYSGFRGFTYILPCAKR